MKSFWIKFKVVLQHEVGFTFIIHIKITIPKSWCSPCPRPSHPGEEHTHSPAGNRQSSLSVSSALTRQSLFSVLYDHLNNMERDFTQRLVVLSFSALLATPPTALPEIVRNNFPAMFQQVIRDWC